MLPSPLVLMAVVGIFAGLGKIYVADERFRKNIDKYGEGTAEFAAEGIRIYVENK